MKEDHMAKEAHIMMATTKNYIVHCIETLYSLKTHCQDYNLVAHLVVDCHEDEISAIKASIDFLDDIQFRIYTCDKMDRHLPKDDKLNLRLTKMTYARCFAHEYLDSSIKRFLWVDADVLFCSSKAANWLSIPFNFNLGIGVKDQSVINFDIQELQNIHSLVYANAGIMAYDLHAMRLQGICDEIDKFFTDVPEWFILHNISDQTVVNYVLRGRIKFIDGTYNVQSIMHGYPQYDAFAQECGYVDQKDMIEHAIASHMMGAKPWEERWDSWQKFQVPLKAWQKRLYDNNCQHLAQHYGEKYAQLKYLT